MAKKSVQEALDTSAWGPAKVAMFKEAFFDFLTNVLVNSKEKGGDYCLADGVYEAQHRFLNTIFDALALDIHDIKVLKSRQLGISTISRALVVFWLGMFKGIQGAMVFDTAPHMQEARAEVESMIRNLPRHLKFPGIASMNRDMLKLTNGSTIRFMAAGVRSSKSSGTLGRSSGINLVHASELCSWENDEGIVSFRQALAEEFPDRLYIWESPLALDTPIATPRGWTTMGAIKEGDCVFNEQGERTTVIGLSPVFAGRKCYEITFSNGDVIVADGVHKWQVEEMRWPTNQQWKTRVVTTEELSISKHRIRVGKPLQMPETWLPIDPYLLGMWLGDGTTANPAITAGDEDIEELRAAVGQRGYAVGEIRKTDWRVGKFTVLGQRTLFSRLKLLGNKHIPAAYLRASETQRRELLAGLMDTDGHVSKDNFRAEFCSIYPHLVDQVADLLSSLGIKFSRNVLSEEGKVRTFPGGNTNACRASERLRFSEDPALKVFNLRRKRDVHETPRTFTWRKAKFLKIASIKEIPSVPVRCISVDSPSHLFLAGRTMIPTHNTARGFNSWEEMWQEAKADTLNQRTVFLGWYLKPTQMLKRGTPAFEKYGKAPPTLEERKRMATVKELYGDVITPEQLAWFRRKSDPLAQKESDDTEDQYLKAEQAWTEDEAFQMSGSTFFDAEKLTELSKAAGSDKYKSYWYFFGSNFVECDIHSARTHKETKLKVWEEPLSDSVYVVAADPAYGHDENNDRSAVQVFRCFADRMEQVAEYACATTTPEQLSWVITSLAGAYGREPNSSVYLIYEINGPGEAVLVAMKNLKLIVSNGYLQKPAREKGLLDVFNNVRQYIYGRSDSMTSGSSLMWKTTTQLKVAIMERLRDGIKNDLVLLRSRDTLEEMKSVARNGDTIKAEGKKKDDRVMTAAMAMRAWEEKVRRMLITTNRTKEADVAKRSMSLQSQFQLFSKNTMQGFFQTKNRQRVLAIRAAQKDRHRPMGKRR